MDTATISYRVADFLEKYPPFQAMAASDVLDLAGRGRVRFHERHEHILWQGEAHKPFVFVIQQGVVSVWDEVDGVFELRDVRGAGDLLGVDRFNDAPACLHSARAATDVVLYAFNVEDIAVLLDKYPHAKQYVSAYANVTLDDDTAHDRRHPESVFLHEVVKAKRPLGCRPEDSVRDAAQAMRTNGVDAIVVISADRRPRGVLTAADLVAWIAVGAGNAEQPVADLLAALPVTLAPDASVADGVLAMAAAGSAALAITQDGTPNGEFHALVTSADLVAMFGDQPSLLLREIRGASAVAELRALNHRARAFALEHLAGARSVDWLAQFITHVDAAIVRRVIALAAGHHTDSSGWAFIGTAGRGEPLTRLRPDLIVATDASSAGSPALYRRVIEWLGDCDYLAPSSPPFDASFYCATADEWRERYVSWVRDPIRGEMYRARALFDLRAVHGSDAPWRDVEASLARIVDKNFLGLLANDCLANLPPLTFFDDAVVDGLGAHSTVFEMERTALRPLIDVARVFGMAAGRVLGGSTRERFAMARRLLPQHDALLREAGDTFSVLQWQEGRIGISQGTSGAELPPSLLSRYDRQVLKGGFRVIRRLIEFTAGWTWLDERL
jgi:CBS domain-containing protein